MAPLAKQTALVVLAALLATSTLTSAVTFAGRTCPADDPISDPALDMTTGAYAACVAERCLTTTGSDPTAPSPDGHCDGIGAAEGLSSESCDTILTAFSVYYACVLRAMRSDPNAPPTVKNAYDIFLHTPGVPYSLSAMPCYSCTNFDSVFASTALPSTCASSYTCETCCGQNPTTNWVGSPGKGYNRVLCGDGCVTALMMTAFTLLSAFIFLMCGCCWPAPSLKSTVEQLRREAEEEKARAMGVSSDDDRAPRQPADEGEANHEPAGDEEYPTEPQGDHQPAAAASEVKSEEEL